MSEKERERERESVCVCVSHTCIHSYLSFTCAIVMQVKEGEDSFDF